MSRKYKFHEKDGAYFISFATVFWIDLFTRMEYFDIVISSLDYCRKNKGMIISRCAKFATLSNAKI
jgi:hypothetical protein